MGRTAAALAVGLATLACAGAAAAAPTTSRVSFTTLGTQRTDTSLSPAISADGKVVAYETFDGDPRGGNYTQEVYAYDMTTGETEWISAGLLGAPGNGQSFNPSISADGRYVAFQSSADNLVLGDTNERSDIFVRDRRTGDLERISDPRGGNPGSFDPSLSPGARFVAFASDGPRPALGGEYRRDVLVHDRQTGQTEVVNRARPSYLASEDPSISAGGRFVAFERGSGIEVRDRETRVTEEVPVPTGGRCARIAGPGAHNPSSDPSISANGRFVALTNDTRTVSSEQGKYPGDVFVHDRRTGRTECVSVNGRGRRGNAASGGASISPNGRYVAFASYASNLVPNDTNKTGDVFVRDRRTGTTRRVSISSARNQGNLTSGGDYFGDYHSAISAGGRFVAFASAADNLVGGDTNDRFDVFVRGPLTP